MIEEIWIIYHISVLMKYCENVFHGTSNYFLYLLWIHTNCTNMVLSLDGLHFCALSNLTCSKLYGHIVHKDSWFLHVLSWCELLSRLLWLPCVHNLDKSIGHPCDPCLCVSSGVHFLSIQYCKCYTGTFSFVRNEPVLCAF